MYYVDHIVSYFTSLCFSRCSATEKLSNHNRLNTTDYGFSSRYNPICQSFVTDFHDSRHNFIKHHYFVVAKMYV